MLEITQLLDVFNSREKATIFWVLVVVSVVIIALFLGRKNTLKNFIHDSLKIALKRKIILSFLMLWSYVGVVVFLLDKIGFWTVAFTKDTVFWSFGGAVILLFQSTEALDDPKQYFKQIALRNVELVLFLEFLLNLYTFRFEVELIIIPLVSFLVIVKEVSKTQEKSKSIHQFSNFLLGGIGLLILGFSIYEIVRDYHSYLTANQILSFSLPFLLSFSLIPFLYPFIVVMAYEDIFSRLSFGFVFENERSLKRFTQWQIIKSCHINLRKLIRVRKKYVFYLTGLRNKEEILDIFEDLDERTSERETPNKEIWSEKEVAGVKPNEDPKLISTKEERKKLWIDLIRAEDRAQVEADIEYPTRTDDVTTGFTFQNERQIVIDGENGGQILSGSLIKIEDRRRTEEKIEFYGKAYHDGVLIGEGWFQSIWLINQGLSLYEKNSNKNLELAEELVEKYKRQVMEKYGIDEETANSVLIEGSTKFREYPELPTIDQYLEQMGGKQL